MRYCREIHPDHVCLLIVLRNKYKTGMSNELYLDMSDYNLSSYMRKQLRLLLDSIKRFFTDCVQLIQ